MLLNNIDQSWIDVLSSSFDKMDKEYLHYLHTSDSFFPNRETFLSAFKTLSKDKTKYILFGQDPYPRYESAIGYSFIDGKVKSIWSNDGLSKEVNKATSLRNFVKMLLLIRDDLQNDLSQQAIAKLDKSHYIDTIFELKNNFEKNGVLLLNTSLIFENKDMTKYHTKMWLPFMNNLLSNIDNVELILFGNIAQSIEKLDTKHLKKHYLEHPYNVSFITNNKAKDLFFKMDLLNKKL